MGFFYLFRVLRPPGGGSSDIFGAENAGTPRTVRNHMASNIFGSTQDAPVKNNGKCLHILSLLFGLFPCSQRRVYIVLLVS